MGKQKVITMAPKHILFVCTGNLCRSVMAEGLFKNTLNKTGLNFQVASAGTEALPGMAASDETIKLLNKKSIDVRSHRAKKLTREMILQADFIFVMEQIHRDLILEKIPAAKGKLFLLGDFYPHSSKMEQSMGIPDPMGMSSTFYENVYEIIRNSCHFVLMTLQAKASPDLQMSLRENQG